MFGLARWPLLVYLGAQLGDKLPVDLYQRHRSTDQWAWPPVVRDSLHVETIAGDDGDDAVLVLARRLRSTSPRSRPRSRPHHYRIARRSA